MEVKISYRHLGPTDSIEEKIRQKSLKLKKYFHGKMEVNWICSVNGDSHNSEVTVRGDHFQAHASSAQDVLYKTFDDVVEKLEKQLARKNEQVKEKIHRKTPKSLS